MSVNHREHAKHNSEPYQGEVTKTGSPQADGEKWSVVEAANYYDLPPILARFGDWAICEDGIYCLYGQDYIEKSRLNEPDWLSHYSEKTWVSSQDFTSAFETAKKMLASKKM